MWLVCIPQNPSFLKLLPALKLEENARKEQNPISFTQCNPSTSTTFVSCQIGQKRGEVISDCPFVILSQKRKPKNEKIRIEKKTFLLEKIEKMVLCEWCWCSTTTK